MHKNNSFQLKTKREGLVMEYQKINFLQTISVMSRIYWYIIIALIIISAFVLGTFKQPMLYTIGGVIFWVIVVTAIVQKTINKRMSNYTGYIGPQHVDEEI